MAQPLAVPSFSTAPTMLPAAYMIPPSLFVHSEGDMIMHEVDPLKGSLRIDECDDEDDVEMQPRAAKRSRVSFQCAECGTSYTEKRALARHRHTDQHRKKLGLPPNKKHSCVVCKKLFGRGHDLKRHYNEQHPDHAAERTTPGSTHSAEHGSSGSDYGGSDHAFSTDGAAGSSASPMTAATAQSATLDERCRSSSSLPDGKPPPGVSNSPLGGQLVRKVRTMSDLRNTSSLPVIKMDQIDEMDVDDIPAPAFFEHPHLRPSASMGSLAQRSEASSSRLSQYSTDQSITTGTTESVPDLHPYMAKAMISKELDLNAPLAPNNTVRPMACTMCSDAFEDDPDELLKHLRRHLDELKGEFRCHECFIGFVHKEDLVRHQQCAAEGNCGFNFPHLQPCTGHHPPNTSTAWIDNIPDADTFRLCTKLRHWEQSQLRAYVSEVNSLIAARKNPRFERWSVGHIMRQSRSSFRVSVNTYASAPCDVDEEGKHDIGGLQQRLRQMSLKKTATSLKDIIRKQRVSGASTSEAPPGTVSKQLANAIARGHLPRAERLLREESQQKAINYADNTLTAQALWSHDVITPLIAKHRFLEEYYGICTECHIDSSTFSTGLSKITMLIKHGARVNQSGGLCGYPLNSAAWMGKADVVKYLLSEGAHAESWGNVYGTPLCTAAAQADSPGALKVVNTLLASRADVHSRGPEGTALELAKRRMEALSREVLGDVPARGEHPVRTAWCNKILEVLETAERCRTPPMTGTLYCQDTSFGGGDGSGVATFRSFRQPKGSVGVSQRGRGVVC